MNSPLFASNHLPLTFESHPPKFDIPGFSLTFGSCLLRRRNERSSNRLPHYLVHEKKTTSTSPMAPGPFAQDAWTRARERFVEDLSEEEKNLYYQSTPEMIFYDASAAQKQHSANSVSLNLAKKVQPLISAIEQYGNALDVYANAYPLALSPLWGSLRIVLHVRMTTLSQSGK